MIIWEDIEKHTELRAVANHHGVDYDDFTSKMQNFERRDRIIRNKPLKDTKYCVDKAWNEYKKSLEL